MKLCIDTFNEEVLDEVLGSGLIHGLTMNPLVMAEEGRTDYLDRVQRMSARVAGPVLVQVVSRDPERMLEEARLLAALEPRIHVKIAFDSAAAAGVVQRLHDEGIKTAATIIYNALQAYLAAAAGAAIVALFEGGLHGISKNPIAVERSGGAPAQRAHGGFGAARRRARRRLRRAPCRAARRGDAGHGRHQHRRQPDPRRRA